MLFRSAYQINLYKTTNENLYKISQSFHQNLKRARQELAILKERTQITKQIARKSYRNEKEESTKYQTPSEKTNRLTEESQKLKEKISELDKTISKLKESPASGSKKRISELEKELRLYKGNIKSLSEKDQAIRKNRQAMARLKTNVHTLKKKRQEKIDQAKAAIGNNGYLVKNGTSTIPQPIVINLKQITVEK